MAPWRGRATRARHPHFWRGVALAFVLVVPGASCTGATDEPSPEPEPSDTASPNEIPASPGTDVGSTGGTLTVVPNTAVVSLDVFGPASLERTTTLVAQHIFDSLVQLEDGQIGPSLATEWSNPDDNTWVFELRDDVVFHDGSPLTAEDVKASLEYLLELEGPAVSLWTLLDEVVATDDYTVTFRTTEPMGTMLSNLSLLFIAPADSMRESGFAESPIGSGPFSFDSFAPSERVVLSANDQYWDGRPSLDELVFEEIPEVSSRITALQTGEVDVIWDIPPDQVPSVQSLDDVTYQAEDSFVYYLHWFNQDREPFNDPLVRRALWHAVDVQTIVESLFGDLATAATAPIPSTVFGYSKQPLYEYDPELAKSLLTQAGYPDGFSTTLNWSAGCCPQIDQLAQSLLGSWAEVGVEVEPFPQERSVWVEDLLGLNWDMNLFSNTVTTGDADFTLGRLYDSSAERLGLDDDEVDALIVSARTTIDQAEREAIYAELIELIWDNALGVYTAELRVNYAWRSTVDGIVLSPNLTPDFGNASLEGASS